MFRVDEGEAEADADALYWERIPVDQRAQFVWELSLELHALSHPVGALYNTHHGLTNAVFMPYVLDFNREALWDKIDRLAAWLGIEGGFPGFLDFTLRFRRDLAHAVATMVLSQEPNA